MRHISFALTTEQIRQKTKTVTRRMGWKDLCEGTLLQPVAKSQGLRKGEKVQKLGGPIRVLAVRQERLIAMVQQEPYGSMEVQREGFGGRLTPREFVEMFTKHNKCTPVEWVTRIEFDYVKERT